MHACNEFGMTNTGSKAQVMHIDNLIIMAPGEDDVSESEVKAKKRSFWRSLTREPIDKMS